MKKTLFEQSYEEWAYVTYGSSEHRSHARAEWRKLCVAEWARIEASLIATGHWHDGKTCREAKCG